MSRKIRLKRGLESQLPALEEAEIGFTTDTKKTYIGSKTGNVELAKKQELTTLETTVSGQATQLAEKAKQTDLDATNTEVSLKATKTELANVLDGTPKGTYATLAELETAFPTGTTGVYIVTSGHVDGNHIYSWSGSAWVDNGLYQAVGIASNGVKLVNAEFIRGAGLFSGLYTTLNIANGTIASNLTGIFTTTVELKAGYTYKVKTIGTHNRFFLNLSNALDLGTPVTKLNEFIPVTGNQEFSFTNTNNNRYLLITMEYNTGSIAPLAELRVTDSEQLKIGNTELFKKMDNEIEKRYLSLELKNELGNYVTGKIINLFNKADIEDNVFVKFDTGLTSANTSYVASKHLPVKSNWNYASNFFDQVAFYDANKVYISGVSGYQLGEITFMTPSNAYYIRVSVRKTKINEYQLSEGTVTPSLYNSYGLKVVESLLSEELKGKMVTKKTLTSISKVLFKAGANTKIKLIGDSITAGVSGTGYSATGETIWGTYKANEVGYCWANSLRDYFLEKFDCTVKNWGVSGRMSQDLLDNIATLVQSDDDIIICMIGTNDRIDSVDNSTTKLYNNLISIGNYVRGQGKEIIFMSSVPASVANENVDFVRRFHMEDVDTVVMAVAEDFNMEYISIYKAFLQYCEFKGISVDTLLKDGVHPNDTGYDVMFNHIVDSLGIGRKRAGATW